MSLLRKMQLFFKREPDGENLDISTQAPLPVSSGTVRKPDIWKAESDTTDFTGGDVDDLFDNLHTVLENSTANNPKEIIIHFNSSTIIYAIGLGAYTGDFSNLEIQFLTSGGIAIPVYDGSGDSTKETSFQRVFNVPAGANAIKLRFHTVDKISLSNVLIARTLAAVARIQAVSELTGLVETILSFRGALNVTDPLVHKLGVNEYFTREIGNNTTLTVATLIGDISITVASTTGLAIGDQVRITQNGTAEVGILTITNIVALVITLDRPLANNFPIGTNVREVENNMTLLAGTLASPISFRVAPPAGQIWQITRILTSMTDGSSSMDDDKFGSLAALTNGSVGRAETIGGRIVNITNWKTNRDLVNDMYDVNYPARTPAGSYALRARWTFTNAQFIVELDGSEGHYLEVLIQDNLTAMDTCRVKAQGRIFGG